MERFGENLLTLQDRVDYFLREARGNFKHHFQYEYIENWGLIDLNVSDRKIFNNYILFKNITFKPYLNKFLNYIYNNKKLPPYKNKDERIRYEKWILNLTGIILNIKEYEEYTTPKKLEYPNHISILKNIYKDEIYRVQTLITKGFEFVDNLSIKVKPDQLSLKTFYHEVKKHVYFDGIKSEYSEFYPYRCFEKLAINLYDTINKMNMNLIIPEKDIPTNIHKIVNVTLTKSSTISYLNLINKLDYNGLNKIYAENNFSLDYDTFIIEFGDVALTRTYTEWDKEKLSKFIDELDIWIPFDKFIFLHKDFYNPIFYKELVKYFYFVNNDEFINNFFKTFFKENKILKPYDKIIKKLFLKEGWGISDDILNNTILNKLFYYYIDKKKFMLHGGEKESVFAGSNMYTNPLSLENILRFVNLKKKESHPSILQISHNNIFGAKISNPLLGNQSIFAFITNSTFASNYDNVRYHSKPKLRMVNFVHGRLFDKIFEYFTDEDEDEDEDENGFIYYTRHNIDILFKHQNMSKIIGLDSLVLPKYFELVYKKKAQIGVRNTGKSSLLNDLLGMIFRLVKLAEHYYFKEKSSNIQKFEYISKRLIQSGFIILLHIRTTYKGINFNIFEIIKSEMELPFPSLFLVSMGKVFSNLIKKKYLVTNRNSLIEYNNLLRDWSLKMLSPDIYISEAFVKQSMHISISDRIEEPTPTTQLNDIIRNYIMYKMNLEARLEKLKLKPKKKGGKIKRGVSPTPPEERKRKPKPKKKRRKIKRGVPPTPPEKKKRKIQRIVREPPKKKRKLKDPDVKDPQQKQNVEQYFEELKEKERRSEQEKREREQEQKQEQWNRIEQEQQKKIDEHKREIEEMWKKLNEEDEQKRKKVGYLLGGWGSK